MVSFRWVSCIGTSTSVKNNSHARHVMQLCLVSEHKTKRTSKTHNTVRQSAACPAPAPIIVSIWMILYHQCSTVSYHKWYNMTFYLHHLGIFSIVSCESPFGALAPKLSLKLRQIEESNTHQCGHPRILSPDLQQMSSTSINRSRRS